MKPGDLVKVKDDTNETLEGVICATLNNKKILVYSFDPGLVHDNVAKKSHMLIVPPSWIFVLKEDQYKVFNKPEIGKLEYGVEKK